MEEGYSQYKQEVHDQHFNLQQSEESNVFVNVLIHMQIFSVCILSGDVASLLSKIHRPVLVVKPSTTARVSHIKTICVLFRLRSQPLGVYIDEMMYVPVSACLRTRYSSN